MKQTFYILGLVFIGVGLNVLFIEVLVIIDNPSKFSLTTNLVGMTVAGLVTLAIGVVLWLKSGQMRFGKATWFLGGVALSWMTWSVIGYASLRARDYTQTWPVSDREIAPEWLSNAKGRRLGNYRLYAPADLSNVSALLFGLKADDFPQVSIVDENADGTVDGILVVDSALRYFYFTDESGNGAFDSYEYTTGIESDSKTFRDDNMDGQYDFRLGPGRAMAVFIDARWRDVVRKDNKNYVGLEDELTRVELYPVVRIVDDE